MDKEPRILVVDDEPSNRMLAERILGGSGYVVTGAADAAAALQAVETHGPFDLYVLDLMMPTMTGTALASAIRRLDASARILYYTGYPDGLLPSTVELPPHDAFIQKPVSVRELREAVSQALFGHGRGP
jgi:CheY-like chemotaxis protein